MSIITTPISPPPFRLEAKITAADGARRAPQLAQKELAPNRRPAGCAQRTWVDDGPLFATDWRLLTLLSPPPGSHSVCSRSGVGCCCYCRFSITTLLISRASDDLVLSLALQRGCVAAPRLHCISRTKKGGATRLHIPARCDVAANMSRKRYQGKVPTGPWTWTTKTYSTNRR